MISVCLHIDFSMERQKAVIAYVKTKQFLSFRFVWQDNTGVIWPFDVTLS